MAAQPYPVERALKVLGANLRTARIRRGLTIAEAAQKIGAGPRAVMDAEKGKPFTGIAVYAALLWLYDLLAPLGELANPLKDEHGLALERRKQPVRARKPRGLDNDF
ncbi:MAG: helix-turn-helix domain-containing protein [Terracidiphilus sp.]